MPVWLDIALKYGLPTVLLAALAWQYLRREAQRDKREEALIAETSRISERALAAADLRGAEASKVNVAQTVANTELGAALRGELATVLRGVESSNHALAASTDNLAAALKGARLAARQPALKRANDGG